MHETITFARLAHQIGTVLKTLTNTHGFTAPIGILLEGADRSKMIGKYHSDPDGPGLALEIDEEEVCEHGFELPIDVEFQDSATRRVAALRIEEQGKWCAPPQILNS